MLTRESQTHLAPLSINYNNATYNWQDNFSKTFGYDSSPDLSFGNVSARTIFGTPGNQNSTLIMTINGTSTYVQSVGNNDIIFVNIAVSGNLSNSLLPKSLVLDQNSTGSSNLTIALVRFSETALKTDNASVSNILPPIGDLVA